ncbi:hypothetical protein F0L74_00030 [Chitinophaga agrisoli]|uniref:Uncharacterized protein n=1 Tax=Chitinophaga agrisoli TaxID=2607653 RepID=A0A5B2VYD6_9BACT|nr:hypothetical protein [Chitinophaga agrisoli]KAA2244411.1 hypothetical protein F0L74_00030 [Chitinophaga agrisoli]
MMKQYLVIMAVLLTLWGCDQHTGDQQAKQPSGADSPKAETKEPAKEAIKKPVISGPVTGERINGPANIRNKVNGEVLFSLDDKALVTCTQAKDGWYQVGLNMDIANDEYGKGKLKKGTPIKVKGKVVGQILKDMEVSTSTNNEGSWAELIGYTHKDNIYPSTIIENALAFYMSTAKDNKRTVAFMQPFINDFELTKDAEQFGPFLIYYNYENWIDDPSAGYRVVLIFKDGRLAGVLHTRPLHLMGATTIKAERGYDVDFYNDTPKDDQTDFLNQFNQFIMSVD